MAKLESILWTTSEDFILWWSYCLILLKASRTLWKVYCHISCPFTKVWKGPQRSFGHGPTPNQAYNQETVTCFFIFTHLPECCHAAPLSSLSWAAVVHSILSNMPLIVPDLPPLVSLLLVYIIYFKSMASGLQSGAHQKHSMGGLWWFYCFHCQGRHQTRLCCEHIMLLHFCSAQWDWFHLKILDYFCNTSRSTHLFIIVKIAKIGHIALKLLVSSCII